MSDGLRIDLALARAAGVPLRSANDATATSSQQAPTPPTGDASTFSPLALLLARIPSSPGAPTTAPTPMSPPTPDEVRLLHAHLQLRVVAMLRDAGVDVAPALRVAIEDDGALRLTPAPVDAARVAQVLAQAPDVARLAQWLQASVAVSQEDRYDDGDDAPPPRAPLTSASDARRVWPWRFAADAIDEGDGTPRGIQVAAWMLAVGLLWLAWRLF